MALNQSTEKPTFCQFPDHPLSLARIQDYVCLFGHVIWFPQALDTYRNFHFQPASSGSAHRNSVRTIYVVMSLIVALFAAVFVGLLFQAFITSITGTTHAKGYLTGLQAAGLGLLVAVILVMVCLLQRVVDWVGLVAIPSAIVATIAFVAYFYGIRVSEFSWLGLITVTCVLGMAFGFMTSILLAYCNCTPPNILYALGFSFFTFVLSLIVIAISGIVNPVAVNGTESVTDSLGVLLVSVLANMVGYLVTFHRIDDWLMGALPRWMAKKRSGTWQKPAVRGSETGGATGNPESSNIRSAVEALHFVPHVTQLPIPGLADELSALCRADWTAGVDVATHIWSSSRQRIPIVQGIYRTLLSIKKDRKNTLIDRIEELTPTNTVWTLDQFVNGDIISYFDTTQSPLMQQSVVFRGETNRQEVLKQLSKVTSGDTTDQVTTDKVAVNKLLIFKQQKIDNYQTDAASTIEGVHDPDLPEVEEYRGLQRIVGEYGDILDIFAWDGLGSDQRRTEATQGELWRRIDELDETLQFARLYQYCWSSDTKIRLINIVNERLTMLTEATAQTETFEDIRDQLLNLINDWQTQATDLRTAIGNSRAHPSTPARPEYIRNPYIYGEPITDSEQLIARTKELAAINEVWNSDQVQTLNIVGPVLSGKTSLLRVADRLNHEQVRVEYISVEHLTAEKPGIIGIVNALFDATLVASGARLLEITTTQRFIDSLRIIEYQLKELCRELENEYRKFIIVFDDFDYVETVVDKDEFEKLLRFLHYMTEILPNFGLVLIDNPDGNNLYNQYRTLTTRLTHPIKIDLLDNDDSADVERLLRTNNPNFLYRFDPPSVEYIMQLTNGHPYLIHLIAWHVFEQYVQEIPRRRVRSRSVNRRIYDPLCVREDIDDALKRPLCKDGIKYYYNRLLSCFKPDENLVEEILQLFLASPRLPLAHIVPAVLKTEPATGESQADEEKVTTGHIRRMLDQLCEHGILEKHRKAYNLKIEILRHVMASNDEFGNR